MKDAEHSEVLEHVLGKVSGAWDKWLECMAGKARLARVDTGTFIIAACTAALLRLGSPPHPMWITTDVSSACLRKMTRHERAEFDRTYKKLMTAQFRWNQSFNEWVVQQQLYGASRGHGPAQLRKYFAAWWLLHRCKKHEQLYGADGATRPENKSRIPESPLEELAATRYKLAEHKRVLRRSAVRGR